MRGAAPSRPLLQTRSARGGWLPSWATRILARCAHGVHGSASGEGVAVELTTRPPPPKLIGRDGAGATRNGEMVEREPGQLRCCPQPVHLLDGCHRGGRPVHVGRVRGEGGDSLATQSSPPLPL